jgi:hypothetical protein
MGGGASRVENVSRTFNESLTENIKNTMIQKSTSIGAVMSSSQIIDFSGMDLRLCDNVNFSDITQKSVISYNFQMLESSIDEKEFRDMMKTNVEKTIEQDNDVKSESLSSAGSDVKNVTETLNSNINRLVSSISYSDFKSIMTDMSAKQRMNFRGMKLGGSNCNFNNISQDIAMVYAAQMISEKVTKEFSQIVSENMEKTDTKSKTVLTATGPIGDLGRGISNMTSSLFGGIATVGSTLMQPMYMIGIVLLFIIVAYVIYAAMGSGKAEGTIKTDEQGRTQVYTVGQPTGQPTGYPTGYPTAPASYNIPPPPPQPQPVRQPLVSGVPSM